MNKIFTNAINVAEDVKQATLKYIKEQIQLNKFDFLNKNASDLRPFLNEVISNTVVENKSFDKETGEETKSYKQGSKCFGTLNNELLKEIHIDLTNWFNNEYFELKFKDISNKRVKDPIKALEEFAKASWNISKNDIPKYLNYFIAASRYVLGKKESFPQEYQKQLWLTSTVMAGGKSELARRIIKGYSQAGFLTASETVALPDNKWPDITPFATNHFVYVSDVDCSKPSEYNKSGYMSIGRKETFVSKRRFIGDVPMKARAVPLYTSNYKPLWQGDRTTINVSCIDTTAAEAIKIHPEIIKAADKSDLSNLYSIANLDYYPENDNSDIKIDLQKYDYLIEIMSKLKAADLMGKIDYSSISISQINNILKERADTHLDNSHIILLSGQLRTLAKNEGIITKLTKSKAEYEKFDLTAIKEWSIEMFEQQASTDELLEVQEEWKRIIDYYKNNNTDPTDDDTFDILDDFMNDLNEAPEAISAKAPEAEVDILETFNYIEEPMFSYKDAFQTYPTNNNTDQFETINNCFGLTEMDKVVGITEPHALARKDSNVSSIRNFIFEGDELNLEEQKQLILNNKDVINRVVFSGSKSLHARITINFEPSSKEEYKWIHNYLNNHYFNGTSDKACSNPSRLTRKPNGVRDNGVKQTLLFKSNTVLQCEELHEIYLKEKEVNDLLKDFNQSTSSYERKTDNIIDELELMSEETKETQRWIAAYNVAINNGLANYSDAWTAISYYLWLGFDIEDIISQVEFKSWNISADTIRRLYS